LVDHFRCHVDADNPALRTDLMAGYEHVVAGARAEVEHGFTRRERGMARGHTATEVEVCLREMTRNAGIGIPDHVQAVRGHFGATPA
jgi:hypothetical protein